MTGSSDALEAAGSAVPTQAGVVWIGEVLSVCGDASNGRKSVGGSPYIEYVFENDLVELDAAGTLAAAEANEHTLITAETRRLQIAAHWADLHPGDAVAQSRLPGRQHPVRLGGDGTPTVADFAPAEFGCVLRISDGSAARLIGDALDLRHRLRLIWAAALTGQVPAYQARRIATATRHLTTNQASWVDEQLAPSLGAMSWGRLQTLLEAKIIEADPVGAEQQATAAASERFVRLGRNSEHGLKLIIARATAGDAIWFKATIDRIADILTQQGDTDPVEVRRSKAIGILAQPAHALQLLCQHQHEEWDGPTEPADAAEEPTEDDEDEGTFADETRCTRSKTCPTEEAEPTPTLPALRKPSSSRPPTRPRASRCGHPSVAAHHPAAVPPGPGPAPRHHLYPSQRRSRPRRQRHRPRRRGRPGAAESVTHPAR